MVYLFVLALGLAPSFIWLLFYLRKDSHPESNRMVLKIFSVGALISLPTALVELGVASFITSGKGVDILGIGWGQNFLLLFLVYNFLGIAFVEEFFKYLVVREKVLDNPEFDEPVDIMLYMIIAALGFAALENVLVLLPRDNIFLLSETLTISVFRFIGATLLHALSSGLVGYFMALAFFETKRHLFLIVKGLGIAALLHGLYNISIIEVEDNPYFIVLTIIILAGLAFFVSAGFKKLKKMSSVCKSC